MRIVERARHQRTGGSSPHPSRGPAPHLARAGWGVMTLASLIIVLVVSRYLTFDPATYFPEQRETYLRLEASLGVHVICGMLALLIGPFQFVRRCRRRFVGMHRALGVVYIASATGLGVTGLVLAPTAYTGPVASAGFTVLALATLFTTWTALRMVLTHRYEDHRRWMIRSFSLILAGVMLRVWVPLFYGLSGAGFVDFTFETAYATIAWLCWVPNVLIALVLTRRSGAPVSAM